MENHAWTETNEGHGLSQNATELCDDDQVTTLSYIPSSSGGSMSDLEIETKNSSPDSTPEGTTESYSNDQDLLGPPSDRSDEDSGFLDLFPSMTDLIPLPDGGWLEPCIPSFVFTSSSHHHQLLEYSEAAFFSPPQQIHVLEDIQVSYQIRQRQRRVWTQEMMEQFVQQREIYKATFSKLKMTFPYYLVNYIIPKTF